MVSLEMEKKVYAKIDELLKIYYSRTTRRNKELNLNIKVEFDDIHVKYGHLGSFILKNGVSILTFDKTLINVCEAEYFEDVIAHELAHAIDCRTNYKFHIKKNYRHHGADFKMIGRLMGVELKASTSIDYLEKRFNFKFSELFDQTYINKIKKTRTYKRYVAVCPKCGYEIFQTKKAHENLISDKIEYLHKGCGGIFEATGEIRKVKL